HQLPKEVPPGAPAPRGRMASAGGRVQISFPQHAAALLDSLNRLRLEGKFCDVVVHVGGRIFPAHKSVLAAASPFFHDKLLLQDGGRLLLPAAIDPDAFEGLLHLIYSGHLTLLLEALPGHLLVASGLQMWHVVDQCSEILKELEGGACRWAGRGSEVTSSSGREASSSWTTRGGDGSSGSTHGGDGSSGGTPPSPLGSLLKDAGEEVLKICVEEDEEEEEEEEEEEGGRRPADTLQLVLEEDEEEDGAPGEPSKIFYIKQEVDDAVEDLLPAAQLGGSFAEVSYVVAEGGGATAGGGAVMSTSGGAMVSTGGAMPSWKPVDLHGNEILGRGQALHAPVKLGAAPDGKRFGCLCGKRFAVKPKRDRHIMLTFSLRPFACAACHKRFKLKHHLTEHMKTHEGAGHACQRCGRRFRLRSGLEKHLPLCQGPRRGGGCWACE
ncbi:ZBTB9 protein, partial [Crotophaga sulcirostris]|nr:ZBTB9 protein [Crotophaga sulcirostris]